jgi:CCR4-NOT transcription complex subunit 2
MWKPLALSLPLFYINVNIPYNIFVFCLRYNRGWFYHKEVHLWLTRISNVEPLVKTHLYERGSYYCFDPESWDTIRKVWSC